MAAGSVVALASTLRRMRDDAGLQVLRADLLPVLVAVLHEHLGGPTRVLAAVDFIEALPRNPSGKILRRHLRDPYWVGKDRQVN